MYSLVLFGFIVHITYFKLRIFSLYVDLKLIYFVFGDFDWIVVEAIVMRMTMGDRMVYPPPPDTLNRFIPSGGINSYIPSDSLWTDTLFCDTGSRAISDPLTMFFWTAGPCIETTQFEINSSNLSFLK